MNRPLTAKDRREFRRNARRLRERKAHPGRSSAHTADELADVFERTALREEINEQALRDFERISRDLDRVREENPAAVEKALARLILEAKRSAEEGGPGSPAAERFRLLGLLSELGWRQQNRQRRQRNGAPALAPGEPVSPIPPDDRDLARGRVLIPILAGG